jgi:hypothetical protein
VVIAALWLDLPFVNLAPSSLGRHSVFCAAVVGEKLVLMMVRPVKRQRQIITDRGMKASCDP